MFGLSIKLLRRAVFIRYVYLYFHADEVFGSDIILHNDISARYNHYLDKSIFRFQSVTFYMTTKMPKTWHWLLLSGTFLKKASLLSSYVIFL